MSDFIPGLVMGFREGLEAFLVVAIIIRYLDKLKLHTLKKYVGYGVLAGTVLSFTLGLFLNSVGKMLGNTDTMAKVWESAASIAALVLVTTFIIWMIKHANYMTDHVTDQVNKNMSRSGVFLVSAVMVAREGVEIAIFTFAGRYSASSISVGIFTALILTVMIFMSLVKVNLSVIFRLTLVYLILQAGYLLGYGLHEGLSALNDAGYIQSSSAVLIKAFDVSDTIFNHKEGIIGLPLNVLLGWYSKPEWIQLAAQYSYTAIMLLLLRRQWRVRKGHKHE